MSLCARCGQGICSTAGKIALNKVWHKNCFCCYNCNRPLLITDAKIYYGEIFCSCCYPQNQLCRVNSTPSVNPDCPSRPIRPVCCISSDSSQDCCRPRDVHSCSCIPACCNRPQCDCRDCQDQRFRRIHCRPRSPKPQNYPPRQKPKCSCDKCCTKRRKSPIPCCENVRKRMIYFQPAKKNYNDCNCCKYCNVERCIRCGEKVFAAEKIPTSNGPYHLGCFSCCCCCKPLCAKSMYEACGEIYCKHCYNNYYGVNGYRYY